MSRTIRIAGYRLKDGKLVRDARRLSVSDRLRQVGSKRVRVVPPSPEKGDPQIALIVDPPRRVANGVRAATGVAPQTRGSEPQISGPQGQAD